MSRATNGTTRDLPATISETVPDPTREKFTFSDMQQMAKVAAHSQMFGRMTEPQILMLMMISHAEGLHPVQALMIYDIVEGKPDVKPAAALARFQKAGGVVDWLVTNSNECSAKFTHFQTCPKGVVVTWTMEDAKRAQLAGKNNWKQYPEDCLVAKVSKRGPKRALPGVLNGVYDVDDFQQYDVDGEPEQPARSKLLDALRAKKADQAIETTATVVQPSQNGTQPEPPKQAITPEVVTEPAKPEPAKSEFRQWVDAEITAFNKSLFALDPIEKPVNASQVGNAIIREGTDPKSDGKIELDWVNTDGKRDVKKAAGTLAALWDSDREWIQKTTTDYLNAKMDEVKRRLAPPREPGDDGEE